MLTRISKLRHYPIYATDGHMGEVINVFFDDVTWTARYLIVETGTWLHRRRVLLSPIAVTSVDEQARAVTVGLTRQQIAESPRVETDMPLSRQMELKYRDYFHWPLYWADAYLEAYSAAAVALERSHMEAAHSTDRSHPEPLLARSQHGDPHLRSAAKVVGYTIIGSDLPAGRLEDFVLDSNGWTIRSLVVHADAAPHGANVLLSPELVIDINWATSSIQVRASRRDVAALPPFRPQGR